MSYSYHQNISDRSVSTKVDPDVVIIVYLMMDDLASKIIQSATQKRCSVCHAKVQHLCNKFNVGLHRYGCFVTSSLTLVTTYLNSSSCCIECIFRVVFNSIYVLKTCVALGCLIEYMDIKNHDYMGCKLIIKPNQKYMYITMALMLNFKIDTIDTVSTKGITMLTLYHCEMDDI